MSKSPLRQERLSVQERYDRLQDAWVAIDKIDAHHNQEGFEIDFDEVRLEASRAVGEVIEHYRQHEDMDDDQIKTIDDLTPHGGIDPRSYLGYAWEIIDGEVGRDWLCEFAELREDEWTDVRCDSCGDIVHMGHDEPDGVWVRIDTLAVCSHCILEKALGIDVKKSGDRDE